ncbi:AraC family transcriptional regulator [Rhizobium sp. P28RR-XV]|uniref:AraC family transcriptional regulator n=1 Tax=Rhizobium sp. P28RR-XV TaxID=2726737 RepID=UPI0014578B5D|nr:AraC family transcriptional regulator [Rhizobium sp. P28RR-XV]NLR86375.1 AraC family transcriptional regulator [Rhizobium sp. P28RR-XV]
MTRKQEKIRLWRDSSLPDGLELLRASCFDYRYPAHFHEEFVVAAFARGAQRHRIAGREGVASAGTILIIPPGEVQTGEAAERDRGWDYCAFYPTRRFLESIADDLLGRGGYLDFGNDPILDDADVTRHLLRAHAVIASAPDRMEKECAAYDGFGAIIARYGQQSRHGRLARVGRADMRRAIDYLQEHFAETVSVSEVATVAGLSEYHFMRVFRASTGLSVHSYLTQIRLNRAKSLLSCGVSSVEAAVSVGFFDQSHLIRHFRQHYGATPREFAAACC